MNFISEDDLLHMIARDQIDDVFDLLRNTQDTLFNTEQKEIFVLLLERHLWIRKQHHRGTESGQKVKLEKLQISAGLIELVRKLEHVHIDITPIEEGEGTNSTLDYRIGNHNLWDELTRIAQEAVVAGGIAAMGFYQEAWDKLQNLNPLSSNPSTNADVEASISILRSIDLHLPKICKELGCDLQYFGEETSSKTLQLVLDKIPPVISAKIKDEATFFSEKKNTIRVIFDAIDGTTNFKKGFPIFCSAIAIIIDNIPRISAIYNPVHHIVYTALLPGPEKFPETHAEANIWHVSIGRKTRMLPNDPSKELRNENIGIHFTRSKKNREQLKEMIGYVEKLVASSSGVYAINSGIFSLTEIARGTLGGFLNNKTNPWDVTAGEVLIKAVGGKVTDLKGKNISYSSPGAISVLAAPTESLYSEIFNLLET